ncbi:MAG: DUF2934 domain-containing protein [Chthoniobacter sp.]|nr:DUF2934 domain-containing protein [Chthoniobacter sp.]
MRKKPDTTKKPSAASLRTTKPAPIAKPKESNTKPPRTRKATPPVEPKLSMDEIATRAYFIAENRRREGRPGDEHQDWLEAERQIRAEAAAAPSKGKKRPSTK